MKHLYLLRHAKSSWANPSLEDQERPLNKRGLRQLSIMAPILKYDGAFNATIYSSSAERALQTVTGVLKLSESHEHFSLDKNLYTFSRKKLLKWLYKLPDEEDCVLVVSHNPALEELLSFLLKTPVEKFPTCSYVHLEIDTPSWTALSPLQARVLKFITPASASYKEFQRKTDKAEFKAKYKLDNNKPPVQEALVRLFVLNNGILPGLLAGIDADFIHHYCANIRNARVLMSILYKHTKEDEIRKQLGLLRLHTYQSNELKNLDRLIQILNKRTDESGCKQKDNRNLLSNEFLPLRTRKHDAFKHSVESSEFHQERKSLKKFLNSISFGELCSKIDTKQLDEEINGLRALASQALNKLEPNDPDSTFLKAEERLYKLCCLSECLQSATQKHKQILREKQVGLSDFRKLCAQCHLLTNFIEHCYESRENIRHEAELLLNSLELEKDKLKQEICDNITRIA